ncbi:hypothetical protein QTI66_32935 [Variovorax sp. J22R133]|uniref:hypothetical protein n=1 Tax=Variovorax brevis TaxID=3053503 RepID=UPI0025773A0E|nr:hypothetical protein [Variovorax sp. J22R133]MDM0116935.1 hypothetical protein [Variovorax sp. J22R133]
MRRSTGFGGRDAAFDSHSCLSRHENDADFEMRSRRWKESLRGRVNDQIWASAHENFHWAQYIATGFGSFLNRLRSERDHQILLALSELPNSAERIADRFSPAPGGALFDYEAILGKILNSRSPEAPIEWAVAYDLLERSVYYADESRHWVEDNDLIGRIANCLLNRRDGRADHESPSLLSGAWPAFDDAISTEQLLESQAVLFEVFYLDNFGHSEAERTKRFSDLQATPYYAAIHYALRELYKTSSDDQFAQAMQGRGVQSFYVSVLICVDLALDVYFPVAPPSNETLTSVDWCPPLRFRDLIDAVNATGLISLADIDDRWTNSRQVFLDYRERLKSTAELRTSTDHDFIPIGDYFEFEAVSRMRFTPVDGLAHLMRDVSLYEIVSNIQALLHHKKQSGIGFLHDPILNLSHSNAPEFSNFFDPNDFRLSCLSGPLNISYANGTIGRNLLVPVLAAQALHSSFGTYALYALAFEGGALQVAPWRIADTINFSGQSVPQFFDTFLQKRLSNLVSPPDANVRDSSSIGDRIVLGSPRETSITVLANIKEDWAAYQRIARAEGHMPVTIELKDDFLRNHAGVDSEALDAANPDRTVCYLQQQCYLGNGESIGLKVHLIDEPSSLLWLGSMSPCRVQLSGKVMSRSFREECGPWLAVLGGMPLSILIDIDADEILEALTPAWEWLAWLPSALDDATSSAVMLAYPIGIGPLPEVGLFRPFRFGEEDAGRGLLDLFGVPAVAKELGIPIFGMSNEQRQQDWSPPGFLVWTVRRYYNDVATFEAITRLPP